VSSTTQPPRPGGVREERKPSLRHCWVVFARRRYDEPLYQVGTVTSDDPEMAVIYAQSIYDEHPWVEMIVVPRHEVRTVIAS
jgi:1,2-phenylacetyl-CoA epoxidase PaaB subunit